MFVGSELFENRGVFLDELCGSGGEVEAVLLGGGGRDG